MFKRVLIGFLMDEAGDANQGGGGSDAPKTFTQDQVNALLAKERRGLQSQVDAMKSQLGEFDTIKAELEKAREEKELAGKTAAEKLEHKYQKDLGLLQKKIEELSAGIAERDSIVKQTESTLFEERLSGRLSAELGKQKIIPQYLDKAAKLARLELSDVKFEDGKWIASYGDHVEKPIADVIAAWAKDNDNFLPAPAGGAGSRAPNGAPAGKKLSDMSVDELLALDAQQRSQRRS